VIEPDHRDAIEKAMGKDSLVFWAVVVLLVVGVIIVLFSMEVVV
jgi:hypothetical protein